MHINDYPRNSIVKRRGEPWIMQVPVISTAHITRSDSDVITLTPALVDGHMCEIPACADIILIKDDGGDQQNLWSRHMSCEFCKLMNTFRQLGYCYVRLDRDGDQIEGLPTFDW